MRCSRRLSCLQTSTFTRGRSFPTSGSSTTSAWGASVFKFDAKSTSQVFQYRSLACMIVVLFCQSIVTRFSVSSTSMRDRCSLFLEVSARQHLRLTRPTQLEAGWSSPSTGPQGIIPTAGPMNCTSSRRSHTLWRFAVHYSPCICFLVVRQVRCKQILENFFWFQLDIPKNTYANESFTVKVSVTGQNVNETINVSRFSFPSSTLSKERALRDNQPNQWHIDWFSCPPVSTTFLGKCAPTWALMGTTDCRLIPGSCSPKKTQWPRRHSSKKLTFWLFQVCLKL